MLPPRAVEAAFSAHTPKDLALNNISLAVPPTEKRKFPFIFIILNHFPHSLEAKHNHTQEILLLFPYSFDTDQVTEKMVTTTVTTHLMH